MATAREMIERFDVMANHWKITQWKEQGADPHALLAMRNAFSKTGGDIAEYVARRELADTGKAGDEIDNAKAMRVLEGRIRQLADIGTRAQFEALLVEEAPPVREEIAPRLNPFPTDAELAELVATFERLYPDPSARETLDRLTLAHTAFGIRRHLRPFLDMVVDPDGSPTYRPSLYGLRNTQAARELAELADAYDAMQAARGDSRRAYRG